ncbi:hypothetical protein [Chromatium okenii]|jgi:hypothetical protein|nr:hypothetical protein [Chromatium okenii]
MRDEYDVNDCQMTDYFRNDVLIKRPYIQLHWCLAEIQMPIRCEIQADDGRIRYWWFVPELQRYLRVVTLADGVTLHNAFPDRRFKP